MVTMVGKQHTFGDAIASLLELEYDALEAYEAAVERIGSQYKSELMEFMSEHRRHITDLTNLLKHHQHPNIPTGPSMGKQWLAKGKVVVAGLVGDKAILLAMQSNEQDTNTAYERMTSRTDKWPDAGTLLAQGFADERKHKAWLEQAREKVTT